MGTDIARRGNDEQQITNRFLHKSQSCGEKACDKKEIRESWGENARQERDSRKLLAYFGCPEWREEALVTCMGRRVRVEKSEK